MSEPRFFRQAVLIGLLMLAVAAHATVTNIAYWRFGENDPGASNGATTASTVNLVGGAMNLRTNVTYTNSVSSTAGSFVGSSLGLRFNSGNYGTNALASTLTNNFGIELWARPDATNTTQCLAYNGNSGLNGWGLYLLNNGQFVGLFGAVGFVGTATAASGVWTHVALVRDGGVTTLYVNGVPSGASAANPNLPAGLFVVAAQAQSLTTEFFGGSLDEVRVFSFAAGGFNTNDLLAINAPPTATNLSAPETYTEDTPLNLTDIVVSDIDSGTVTATLTLSTPSAGMLNTGTAGAVTSTYNVGTGVWTASGAIADVNTLLAGVTFTPTLNFNISFTIATSVSDGALSVSGSKAMTGTPVNDAPTAANLSAAETYTEDTPLNLVDIVAGDVDSATVTATLTLSNPSAGTLSTGTSGAVTATFVAGVWTASGLVGNVNTLLSGVTFTPTANFNSSFSIATSVSDGALSVTGTKVMIGTPVNDAPVLDASKTPAMAAVLEDAGAPVGAVGTLVSSLVDFAAPVGQVDNVTDADTGAALGIAVVAADPNFTAYYSLNGGVTWTPMGSATTSAARLLAADADNRIYLQPALNVNGTFASALTFRAWDQTTGTDGGTADTTSPGGTTAFSSVTDTISQVVTAVNDAPTASNLSAPETYTEDTSLNLVDIVASDIDSTTVTATLTLSEVNAGTLSTGTSGAVTATYNAGTGVWSASGAIADVNTLLAGVTFTPALNFNANFNIATSVSDGALSVTGSKAMTGTPVNDAPVLDTTKSPAMATVLEDPGAPVGAVGTLISSLVDSAAPAGQLDNVTDVDAGAALGIAITAADPNFTGYYSLNGGTTWTPIGTITTATARLLAADADNRIYLLPAANYNGTSASALTFRAWDQTTGADGGTADTTSNGGTTAFSTATDTISQVVTAVNDAPTASNLSAAETYTEDTALNLVDIVASDVDSAIVTATLTLSDVNAGSLSTATSGAVTSSYNPGTGVWTASGAIADVNVLLAGVTFTPAANFNGNFTIATGVSDGSLSVTGTKAMTGTPVNDAPTASNLSAGETYIEDTPLDLVNIVAADIDSTTLTATLTLSDVNAGHLSLGTSGAVISTFNAGVWTASGAIADVNTLLAGVSFTPASHYTNNFTITTSVSDGALSVSGSKAMTGFPASGFIVSTTNNSGPGSLRDVIAAVPAGSTVTFATNLSGQTLTLTNEIILNKNLALTATNLSAGITLSGGGTTRIFYLSNSPSITMHSLSLTGGNGAGALDSGNGGAINVGGSASLTLNQCTLAGNSAATRGGAICSSISFVTLNQCTLAGNSAGSGAAIYGIYDVGLNQCTISGNSSPNGSVFSALGTISLNNTILAGNTGGNINGSSSGANNLTSGDPMLAPLANYGGPTQTRPPLIGSPAVDAGLDSVTNSFTTDQRGLPRLVGAHVDIGAVEGALDASAPIVTTMMASPIGQNTATLNGTVNPRNLATTTWFEWGTTTNYGHLTATSPFAASNTAVGVDQSLGGLATSATYHFRAVATNLMGLTFGADSYFTTLPITGDQNGDGIVSESEINTAFANYLANSPWLYVTNVAGLGGTNVTFALSNTPPLTFTVEYSTDLVTWFPLGPATPRYLFTDTNAPAVPQRKYRLRYP